MTDTDSGHALRIWDGSDRLSNDHTREKVEKQRRDDLSSNGAQPLLQLLLLQGLTTRPEEEMPSTRNARDLLKQPTRSAAKGEAVHWYAAGLCRKRTAHQRRALR